MSRYERDVVVFSSALLQIHPEMASPPPSGLERIREQPRDGSSLAGLASRTKILIVIPRNTEGRTPHPEAFLYTHVAFELSFSHLVVSLAFEASSFPSICLQTASPCRARPSNP